MELCILKQTWDLQTGHKSPILESASKEYLQISIYIKYLLKYLHICIKIVITSLLNNISKKLSILTT